MYTAKQAAEIVRCAQDSNDTLIVIDATNNDAVWYYSDPKPQAEEIKGRVAFWKGVKVIE
jgi:uncharacterized protein (DUF427 family)